MTRAILWDMDGTLADSEPNHDRSFKAMLKGLGLAPSPGLHEKLLGRSDLETLTIIAREYGLDLDIARSLDRRIDAYLETLHRVAQREGAADLYRALAAEGATMAVVSNSDRLIVDANLRAIGLAHARMISIAINDLRKGKPDPEPYARAAWLLQTPIEACMVVEDSATGAASGLAAGASVIFWPQDSRAPTPQGAQRVESPEALEAMLRAWLEGSGADQ